MATNKVYQVITERIVELLKQGVIPWRKPWVNGPATRSYHGHEYRGVNRMLLSATASFQGLRGCWITFNQVKALGGQVKAGAKGIPVVFWKWIEEIDERGEPTGKKIPICRYYTVFSICQTEGIDEPAWVAGQLPRSRSESLEAAEALWNGYQNPPSLLHGGDRAAYLPDLDQITMPHRDQFESLEEYYCTLFHEMTHSTGHASRLDRFKSCEHVVFGSETYSREELVAEMGAAFLAAEAGIENRRVLENTAAYLDNWIKALQGEPRMVVVAAAQAQKAADFILGRKFDDNEGGQDASSSL